MVLKNSITLVRP